VSHEHADAASAAGPDLINVLNKEEEDSKPSVRRCGDTVDNRQPMADLEHRHACYRAAEAPRDRLKNAKTIGSSECGRSRKGGEYRVRSFARGSDRENKAQSGSRQMGTHELFCGMWGRILGCCPPAEFSPASCRLLSTCTVGAFQVRGGIGARSFRSSRTAGVPTSHSIRWTGATTRRSGKSTTVPAATSASVLYAQHW